MLVEAWPAVSRSTVPFVLAAVMKLGVLPRATLAVHAGGIPGSAIDANA
jgi:hypothetical protein